MRNPFRRNKTTDDYARRLVTELVIGTADGVHNVRVTVEYTEPKAALAAMLLLADPEQFHASAIALGVHNCSDEASADAETADR